MSLWTYINGIILVEPIGETQPEKRYVLDTVLAHLPKVTGSEEDMSIYVIQQKGYNCSCTHDEFGRWSNLGTGYYGNFETQSTYMIVVNGSLRDCLFNTTFREFQNWLCRLSKRVMVKSVLVKVSGYDKSVIIQNENDIYTNMFEPPTYSLLNKDGEPTWCEFLLYDKAIGSELPMLLEYKYYNNAENDKEIERRQKIKD